MIALRYATTKTIVVGPMLTTDGINPSTALTLTTAPNIRLSKNHSTYVDRNSTGTVTAATNGYYTVPLSTVDTGTLGYLRIRIYQSATHLPAWENAYVYPVNIFDSLYSTAGDYLQVDAMQIQSSQAKTAIGDAVVNSSQFIEPSYTLKRTLRVMLAALAGKTTGGGTTTLSFYAAGDTGIKRIEAHCGSSGNRKSVTLQTSS